MSLCIVIVNFRTPGLTTECLRSLEGEVRDGAGMKVVVTDNCSGDDSVARIGEAIESNGWGAWAKVVALPKNGGFAYGNNRGFELAGDAKYILMLNSDTLVDRGVLGHCYVVMEKDRGIGMMSCRLKNGDGSMQNAARKFPSPFRAMASSFGLPWIIPGVFGGCDIEDGGWDRMTVKRDVEWIGGAFMFIRAEALRQCGGLDEDFFFYGEDIEFCHRFARRGWRIHYDPQVAITHLGGSSSDATRMPSRQKLAMMWKGKYMLQRKCWGRAAAGMVWGADVVSFSMRWVKMTILGRRKTQEFEWVGNVLGVLMRGK